jgi:hypothetical protein
MNQFLIRLADRLYDRLNNTETARAWNGSKCIAVLRLPKGCYNAITGLADLMSEQNPDDVEIVSEYED